MTLKKSIASYVGIDGVWVPQRDVEMHPLEEDCIMAEREIHEEKAKLPVMPSRDEQIAMIIEHGAEYTKQHMANIQLAHDNAGDKMSRLDMAFREKETKWNDHCKKCEDLKVDKDTHK